MEKTLFNDVFICECNSLDHIIRFWWDEEERLLTLDVRLVNYKDFWQRVKRSIGYIFNMGKRRGKLEDFGDYDSFLVYPEDAKKIMKYLEKYEKI